MTLLGSVFDVHDALQGADIQHAFGGALALGFYADPRATVDIDVNVFAPGGALDPVEAALGSIGYAAEGDPRRSAPIAGVRFRRDDPFPVDVFFPIDDPYDEIAARARLFQLGGRALPFLAAEDLVLFKLSFGRDKDWVDIRRMVGGGQPIDVAYVERQLLALRGPTMHPRLARLRALLDR